jgi:hypothetical protein
MNFHIHHFLQAKTAYKFVFIISQPGCLWDEGFWENILLDVQELEL